MLAIDRNWVLCAVAIIEDDISSWSSLYCAFYEGMPTYVEGMQGGEETRVFVRFLKVVPGILGEVKGTVARDF